MGPEIVGFLGLSRAELAHRILRIVAVRRLDAAALAGLGLAAADADMIVRGRMHGFTADQLRVVLNRLCQRSPERRTR